MGGHHGVETMGHVPRVEATWEATPPYLMYLKSCDYKRNVNHFV